MGNRLQRFYMTVRLQLWVLPSLIFVSFKPIQLQCTQPEVNKRT